MKGGVNMKPTKINLSLTKKQETALYLMQEMDMLSTILMDVYSGREKMDAVESVAEALTKIEYDIGCLASDTESESPGGENEESINAYKSTVGAAADLRIRHQVRALIRRYNTVNPFTLAALSGLTVQRVKLPAGIRGFSMQGGKIFLSRYLLPAQRRRTLAHELGHNILGHLAENNKQKLNVIEPAAQLFAYYLTGEINYR